MEDRQKQMQSITKQLRVVFRAVQAHSKTVEKNCGLSGAKLWMMWELFTTPGIKVSELARTLTIHPSTCSNMLDQLEEKDLVRRDRSKVDQRSVHLYLTETGTALLAKAPRPAQGTMSEALEHLKSEEANALRLMETQQPELHKKLMGLFDEQAQDLTANESGADNG